MSNFFEAGKAAMTSNKDDWETPQQLFDLLDRTYHLLIPARTDTRYFHDFIYRKPNVRYEFLRGRLKFEVGGGCAQFSAFSINACVL